MFSKLAFILGGLLTAVAMIAAVDMYFAREEIVTVEFAHDVIDEILEDPEARRPLVDQLTNTWIEVKGLDRSDAATRSAVIEMRQAVDTMVAGDALRLQVMTALDDLARREDELGIEQITIDLRPAIDDAAGHLPPPALEGIDGNTFVTLSADLTPLSAARRGMRTGSTIAIAVAAVLVLAMALATASLRRTVGAVALFGFPLSLLQPAILARNLEQATFGHDLYRPIVTRSITERLEPGLDLVVSAFGLLVLAELLLFVVGKFSADRDQDEVSTDGPVEQEAADPERKMSTSDVDWFVKERYEDRVAS